MHLTTPFHYAHLMEKTDGYNYCCYAGNIWDEPSLPLCCARSSLRSLILLFSLNVVDIGLIVLNDSISHCYEQMSVLPCNALNVMMSILLLTGRTFCLQYIVVQTGECSFSNEASLLIGCNCFGDCV